MYTPIAAKPEISTGPLHHLLGAKNASFAEQWPMQGKAVGAQPGGMPGNYQVAPMTPQQKVKAIYPSATYLPTMATVMSDDPRQGLGIGRPIGCGLGKGIKDAVALRRAAWQDAADRL